MMSPTYAIDEPLNILCIDIYRVITSLVSHRSVSNHEVTNSITKC